MHSVWRAFYTTYIWIVVHMLSGSSQWLRQQHIVVINGITIYIYVIHWDALSYHTGSAAHHIRLYIVMLCKEWRDTRDSRWLHRIVYWTRTGWVWFSTPIGKRSQRNRPHSHSTNRAPQWKFYASLWKFYDFSEKHRKPLWRKGFSGVKQGNTLLLHRKIDEKPCKSTVWAWWYRWYLNGACTAL